MSSASLNKLRCKVVSYSSEDDDYPANQLNTISPNTRGWQSARFCTFPQELGFQLVDGEAPISQLQLLSHQSKISKKIEMFIGHGSSYKTATFTRLGYMSLDSNERSMFQARELKTIYIDNIVGSFIKLIISENHLNKQNIYAQVGIIAVSLLGPAEEIHDTPGAGSKFHSVGGKAAVNNYNDLSIDLNLDPQTAGKLRQLSDAKARAVDAEDYLTAKRIKLVEHELKALGSKLAQMDMAKSDAVAAEDYDLAKEIKDETDQLRREIEDKIMNINIPGVSLAKAAPAKPQRPKFAPESDEKSGHLSSRRVPEIPSAFDEMPAVGAAAAAMHGAYSSPRGDYIEGGMHPSGKKVAKVEALHHDAFDDRLGHGDAGRGGGYEAEDDYADAHFEDERIGPAVDDSHLPYTERVIKPKSNVYDGVLGGIDDDPNSFRPGGGGPSKPTETFPEGQHPLDKVPNHQELPNPEALSKLAREAADQHSILALIGEYRTRCLYSKTWILREAAVKKVLLMLPEFARSPGLAAALPGVCGIIKTTVEDKIQQVMYAGIGLMDELLLRLKSSEVAKSAALPLFDPILAQLVEKLADGNARLREGARKGLEYAASASHVGPGAVASHTARALPPKQKTAWRPISARIQVLTDLVSAYGLGGGSGLSVDMVLGFSKTHQAYAHSTAEVRDEAKKLVVAVQRLAGTAAVESTLKLLRPKQMEEYNAAFEAASGDHPTPMHAAAGKNPSGGAATGSKASPGLGSPARVDKHLQHATHTPGGKVPTSAAKANRQSADDPKMLHGAGSKDQSDGGDEQDFTTCMFCQMHDKSWNENDLDVHYWKDCPLLISCPSCAQIVEIAGLPEHLLDECDEKDAYVPCDITGLAIRANEFDNWKKGPNCVQAPHNCMYCPLCLASVEDSDAAWLAHLKRGCPRNARTNGS